MGVRLSAFMLRTTAAQAASEYVLVAQLVQVWFDQRDTFTTMARIEPRGAIFQAIDTSVCQIVSLKLMIAVRASKNVNLRTATTHWHDREKVHLFATTAIG